MCQICLKFATFAENKLRSANRKVPFLCPRLHYFWQKISYARQAKVLFTLCFCEAYWVENIKMK